MDTDQQRAPDWLGAYYDAQRRRSAKLVEDAVVALLAAGEKITEERVIAHTKALDPEGRGISRSTLRRNPACQRRFVLARGGGVKPRKASAIRALFAAVDRDGKDDAALKRRAQRLMRLRKDQLVAQLMAIERRVAALEAAGYAQGEAEYEKALRFLP